MAGWYTNKEGVAGQNDINALLSAYKKGASAPYDPVTNRQGRTENYYMDAIARRIKELSGVDANLGDDAIRIGYQGMEEERKRKALGEQQQQQILGFADQQQGRINDFRGTLAQSLANSGREFFKMINPDILEDLNSRGLFTSQTARDDSQAEALKEIELNNQAQLLNFDTNSFNEISDIRGSALNALLGGEQSALDAALESRKAALQRNFDLSDQARAQAQAEMLAKRQSRNQLTNSLLGLGGQLGGALIGSMGGPAGSIYGSQLGGQMFSRPTYGQPGYSFLPPSLSLYR